MQCNALRSLLVVDLDSDALTLFEKVEVEDLQMAADVLRPVYDQTEGADGFVSIEVSPRLAYDTAGSIEEARRLWKAVNRPNLMVKIPSSAGFSGRFPQLLSRNVVLRTGTKEIARHVVIALANIACVALFWQFFSIRRDVISRLSIAIAYPALFLTAAAVCIGPWNVLRGRTNSVSFDLRRDLGIWAGIMALLHTGIGLNVYLRGRPWLYFIDQHHRVRHDLFGIGNDTGLLAALLFLLLLAISNDLSLRHLGTRIWKSLQRWTYLAVALTLMHAVAYQFVEKRRAHTTRYYGLRSQRLPCSRLRDGAERRENGIGAHWYLQASNRLLDGLADPVQGLLA